MSVNVEWLIQRADKHRAMSRQHKVEPRGRATYAGRTLCGQTIPSRYGPALRIDYGAPDRRSGKCRHCRRLARLLDKEN